ncbi:LysM domain-containing protein 6 [Elsinoe fawcettii]|nr:LysM domain-containing protein 6 [Elsinoe fawcettii]
MRRSRIPTVLAVLAASQAQACTFTAAAWSGLTCDAMARQWSISTDQFISWNPSVGSGCANGLVAGTKYCVEGGTASTPAPPGAPSPTQPGINGNCANFYQVQSGDFCQKIIDQFRISLSDFYSWNPSINNVCSNLIPSYYVCVGLRVAGGFQDRYPGMNAITSVTGLDIIPPNPDVNPLRISGRVLGVGSYPENTWVDWLNTIECESPGNPRKFDHYCDSKAFVSIVSSAVQAVANDRSLPDNINAAAVRVIGPYYTRNNAWNLYTSDNGQGKSCSTCAAPVQPKEITPWKGTFLPDGTVYYLKTRRIKVTCKKSCAARDVNVQNLEGVISLIPWQIRQAKGAGANFFIWRQTTREVVARCRVTYVQNEWFDRVDGGADQVYGGEEEGSCFRQL